MRSRRVFSALSLFMGLLACHLPVAATPRFEGQASPELPRDFSLPVPLFAPNSAWNQTVVLKGAHTVVASPGGQAVIVPFANAGLATAGTGDILAGAIVALRAQGVGAFEAAAAGAHLHGLAGEFAREAKGTAGMVAGDVLACLPQALQTTTST